MAGIVWTQEDLDKLKAAYLALASGEKVLTVSYDGPPRRTVTYQQAQIGEVRQLIAEMNRQVGSARSYRLARWRQGFRDG